MPNGGILILTVGRGILLRTKIASQLATKGHTSMRKSLGILVAVVAAAAILGLLVAGADETTLKGIAACA
jgi:hypothetical protein